MFVSPPILSRFIEKGNARAASRKAGSGPSLVGRVLPQFLRESTLPINSAVR